MEARPRAPRRRGRRSSARPAASRTTARPDRLRTSGPAILRILTVLAAAVTVLLSWPAWQVHTAPPQLPLLPLPAVSTGVALLVALALCLVAPLAGWCAYVAVFVYAVLTDQTRLQPEFITFAFFLAAGLPGTAGPTLARAYLITLWFYAGVHKLLSVDFMSPERHVDAAHDGRRPRRRCLRTLFPWAIVAAEMGIAVLALVPRTRRLAVRGSHPGARRHPPVALRADWNPTVWPWNRVVRRRRRLPDPPLDAARCATTGVSRVRRCASRPSRWRCIRSASTPASSTRTSRTRSTPMDQPRGYVCNFSGEPGNRCAPGWATRSSYRHADGPFQCREVYVSNALGIPLPPLHRLYADYFTRTCAGDEFLLVLERRRFTPDDDRQTVLRCPGAGADPADG